MAFEGMDPAQVQALANQMSSASNEIQHVCAQLTNLLNNTHWVGQDHDRFVSDVQGSHVPQLTAVANALQEEGQRANFEAQQQINASAT